PNPNMERRVDKPIHSVDAVPLDRHAVLEASAGTGKTYTLERLVLRLVTERGVGLDRILVVTYTEKATGELRGRLRKTLEAEVGRATEHRTLLQKALDEFDQAPIYTIHAFCQKVLQEHAFDHGQDFSARLVDDDELLWSCLREIQRKDWPGTHGDNLRAVL